MTISLISFGCFKIRIVVDCWQYVRERIFHDFHLGWWRCFREKWGLRALFFYMALVVHRETSQFTHIYDLMRGFFPPKKRGTSARLCCSLLCYSDRKVFLLGKMPQCVCMLCDDVSWDRCLRGFHEPSFTQAFHS